MPRTKRRIRSLAGLGRWRLPTSHDSGTGMSLPLPSCASDASDSARKRICFQFAIVWIQPDSSRSTHWFLLRVGNYSVPFLNKGLLLRVPEAFPFAVKTAASFLPSFALLSSPTYFIAQIFLGRRAESVVCTWRLFWLLASRVAGKCRAGLDRLPKRKSTVLLA